MGLYYKNQRQTGLLYIKEGHDPIPLKPEYDTIIFQKPYFKGYKGGVAAGSFKDPIYDYGADIAPVGKSAEKEKRDKIARQKQEEAERKTVIENLKRNASPEDLEHILPIELTQRNKYVVKYRDGKKYGQALFSMNIDEKTKYLTKRIVFPPVYDSILEMHAFNYLIKRDGKYGFLQSGQMIIEPQYDDIKFPNINTDYLLLKKGKKYVIYMMNGGMLPEFEFDDYTFIPASEYTQHTILKKGRQKVLLTHAKVSQEYDELIPVYQTTAQGTREYPFYFKCKKDGKWGVVSTNNKIPVPPVYDDIPSEEPGFYTTIIKGKKGAYLEEGKRKINIPPRYKSIQQYKIINIGDKALYLFRVEDEKGVFFYTDRQGREFYKS